jgi:hypothetical protein
MSTSIYIEIKGFRPIGAADSGECDRCGTMCPKERVLMAVVDQDGNTVANMTENWGKCCAAQYCYGAKTQANRRKVEAAISQYQAEIDWKRAMLKRRIATGTHMMIKTFAGYQTLTDTCMKQMANRLYSMSGAPRVGSFFMQNPDGHVVRTSESDSAFYADMGFVQISQAVTA